MSENGHMNEHDKMHAVEGLAGLGAEVLKQGGYLSSQAGRTAHQVLTGTHLGHAGAQMAQTAAKYAPVAVAALGAVAPVAAVAAGMGYAAYKLVAWLCEE